MRNSVRVILLLGALLFFFLGSAWVVGKQQSTPEYLAKSHYGEIVEISEYPRFCERGEEKIIKLGQKFNAELKRGKLSYAQIGITEDVWRTAVQKAWANTYAYYVDKAKHASEEDLRGGYYKKALICYLRAQQWARGENQNFTEDAIPRLVDEGPGGEAELDPKVAEVVVRIIGENADLEHTQKVATFRSGDFEVLGKSGYFEVKLFASPENPTSDRFLPTIKLYLNSPKPSGAPTLLIEDTRMSGIAEISANNQVLEKEVDFQDLYHTALAVAGKS